MPVPTFVAFAAPPAQSSEAGEAIFTQKCSGCHTVGQGDKVGPDLDGVTRRRNAEWLTRWLLVQDEMLAEEDPFWLFLQDSS